MKTCIEYRYRVRIFGETGRRAVELPSLPMGVYGIDGRTVFPDGKVILFNQVKDFASKTISVGSFEGKQTVLIPPGVNSDCVVEMTWREPSASKWRSLPARMENSHIFDLAGAFPTMESVVALPDKSYALAHLALPTSTVKPEKSVEGGYRVYTFRNVPAKEEVPYALEVTREFPRFVVFDIPVDLWNASKAGPANFWKVAGSQYLKNLFIGMANKGQTYRALERELWEGISGSPTEQAAALMVKLDGRIKNLSTATVAELTAMSRAGWDGVGNVSDLEATAQRGATTGVGMTVLYFNLLLDRGIPAKVILVADRNERIFEFNLPDVGQFRSSIVQIEEPGKPPLRVQPSLRYAPPGMVHPSYQGAPGLLLDPNGWGVSTVQVSAQAGGLNVRRFAVEVFPGEDSDRFTLAATFTGYPEWAERESYLPLESSGQVKRLKERLEGGLPNATLTKVEVRGAQDSKVPFSWRVEGRLEREDRRLRKVRPFPGVPTTLAIPESLPAKRTDPILVPYLRVQESTSTVHIPMGWKCLGSEDFERTNRFGSVSWSTKPGSNGTLVVRLKVEVRAFFEPSSTYEEFKDFLGWVKEASGRVLAFEETL
ncbi:MAG TPA: hypothetical protein VJ623_13700 [Holophagaceae bacterium]|nr:hypothetical protein [Holophagaceae bacterium]